MSNGQLHGGARTAPHSQVTLPPVLRQFCWTVLMLTAVSTGYCVAMRYLWHRHYPYDWPFYFPKDRFNDFTIYQQKFELFHQSAFFTSGWPFTYPSPMALVYELFYKGAGQHALAAFILFLALAFVVPAILFGRALAARGLSAGSSALLAAGSLVLSWPALLMLDRANVEVFVWVALLAATWAYARGKEWTAAAFFGMAASMKLFPFVYLALFLTRGKYPKLLFGVLVFAAATVVSLAILGPTIPVAYHGITHGLEFFHDTYMAAFLPNESGVDHSVLSLLKVFMVKVLRVTAANPHYHSRIAILLAIYMVVTAVGGLLLYFLLIRKLPRLNQLFALTIVSIYITPYSGDGTLVHLYYSFALCCFLAIDAWRRQLEIPGLRNIFLCFAFLFSIESFFIFRNSRYEGQAKCIAIGVLLVLALRYPLGPPLGGDDDQDELAEPDASRIQDSTMLPTTA